MVSALFHYLGPSFAVLLFNHVGVLGVAWLRIASAAAIFAIWRRPWRVLIHNDGRARILILGLGVTLALMNSAFYLAIDRMPLATVAAIEFVATIVIALIGVRTLRNVAALAIAVTGVFLLIGFQWSGEGFGMLFAVVNAILFGIYIVLGHAVSRSGGASGIDLLGAAMLVALIVAMPIGVAEVVPVLGEPRIDPRRDRRRRLFLGNPLHLRSARDGAVAARDLRADADPAARDRLHRRRRSPRSSADPGRNRRDPARRDRSGRS